MAHRHVIYCIFIPEYCINCGKILDINELIYLKGKGAEAKNQQQRGKKEIKTDHRKRNGFSIKASTASVSGGRTYPHGRYPVFLPGRSVLYSCKPPGNAEEATGCKYWILSHCGHLFSHCPGHCCIEHPCGNSHPQSPNTSLKLSQKITQYRRAKILLHNAHVYCIYNGTYECKIWVVYRRWFGSGAESPTGLALIL